MKKEMHVCEFTEDLLRKLDESKDVTAYEEEIRALCNFVTAELGDKRITVDTDG